MSIRMTDLFLGELDREAASTRRVLERVPEGRNDWKPHARSMPLGYLAALVAKMPGWVAMMLTLNEMDISSPEGARFKPQPHRTAHELVETLDASVARSREALAGTTDDDLPTSWKFVVSGHVVSELPRHIMLRDAVFSHLAHHRGQLTVYLRLNEARVPSLYGPSADEGQL